MTIHQCMHWLEQLQERIGPGCGAWPFLHLWPRSALETLALPVRAWFPRRRGLRRSSPWYLYDHTYPVHVLVYTGESSACDASDLALVTCIVYGGDPVGWRTSGSSRQASRCAVLSCILL